MTSGPNRRKFLTHSGTAVAGAALANLALPLPAQAHPTRPGPGHTVPFYGRHQAGITTPTQEHSLFAAFDVTSNDRSKLDALFELWTETAHAMSQGKPAPARPGRSPALRADSGIALGLTPARLTITLGLGPSLFRSDLHLDKQRPTTLEHLPAFTKDALDPNHCDGDLLLQICADDPQVVSHAFLQMRAATVGTAALRWSQQGFVSRQVDSTAPRNLLGLHDGMANPSPGSWKFDRAVWASKNAAPWMRGGTFLVFRKIRLALPNWTLTPSSEQDRVVGRRFVDGSPLSAHPGASAQTPLDLNKRGGDGQLLIGPNAHVRLMHPFTMHRRSFNYDYGFDADLARSDSDAHDLSHPGHDAYDAGLLFAAYTADPAGSFVPAQQRINDVDALGAFMTPTGSAVFAVPGGLKPDQSFADLLRG